MTQTPSTPGEIAYAAYCGVMLPSDWRVVLHQWTTISALHKEAWEAAAQAVLVQHDTQVPHTPLCQWCGQPRALHPQHGEPWHCRLSDGPLLPAED